MEYGIIGVTCPRCNYEFKDDLDAIKYRITEINTTIKDIDMQFGILKNASKEEQELRKQWKTDAYTKKRYLTKELLELKVRFDKFHEKREEKRFAILRNIIKDFYGQSEYDRCIEELIKRGNKEFMVGG